LAIFFQKDEIQLLFCSDGDEEEREGDN